MVHLTPRIHKLMHPSSQMKLRAVPKSVHAQVICRIRLFWIPSTTKCLRSPWGQIPGFQNGDSVQFQTFDHPPLQTAGVLDPRVAFFYVVICHFRPLRIFMDHVEVGTWNGAHCFGHCPKCPEFWSLESVPFQEQDFYVYLWHSTGIHGTKPFQTRSTKRLSAVLLFKKCKVTQKQATRRKQFETIELRLSL